MADGTVRGRFALDSRDAITGVRQIRDVSGEADAAVRRLGDSIDDLAGRSAAAASAVKGSWRSMRDSVADDARRMRGAIDEVEVKMDRLAAKRATPKVDLSGVDRALAQLAVLEQRLDSISRQRATPRVAIGGGFAGGPGAFGGGGGGAGGAASSAARAGGGGFPTMPALIGAAGTAIPPLAGTTVALTGSAAAATVGAAEVGAAGLGTLGVGAATEVALARGQTKQIQTAIKDQQAYNRVVAQYGAASKQAATAKAKLDAEYAQNPGLRQATHEINQLTKAYQEASRGGVAQFRGMIGDVARPLAAAAPALAPGITRDAFATRQQAGHLAGFLTTGVSLQTVQQLQSEYARDLPFVERSLQNILTTTDRLVQASLPYFHESVVWIERETAGWAKWSDNTGKVQTDIEHTVTSLKDWAHFGGEAGRVLTDLVTMGRPSGDSAVVSMTHTLDRWDLWLKDNPAKVHQFFTDAERTTGNIAHAVLGIADALFKLANAFGPVLNRFAQLAQLGNGLGLLIPAGLRFAAGHYFGGAGGGGGGGAAGTAALVAGGGGPVRGGGGVVVGGAPPGLGPRGGFLVPSAVAPSIVGNATTVEETAAMAMMMRLRPTARIGGALPGGALAAPEAFSARYGGIAGARYAMPTSQLGPRPTLLAGAAGAAGKVGRFALPILAVSGALGAISTPGTAMERAQGAVSAATFGLVPTPVTGQGHVAAGQQAAGAFIGQIQNLSPAQQEARLSSFIGHERGIKDPGQQPFDPMDPFATKPGYGNQVRVRAEIAALQDAQRQVRQVLNQQAVETAQQWASNFGKAFDTYSHKEGPHKAFSDMETDVLSKLHSLRPAGRAALAQAALDWAKGAAQANPALRKQYEQLTQDIMDQFTRMGQHVAIVNGTIYTGSKSEWGQITQAMQDPLERAREKMDSAFTDIQNQAVGSLVGMGFSHGQAHAIVHGLEQGGKAGTAATAAVSGKQQGGVLGGTSSQAGLAALNAPKRATGGRLGGVGVADTVRMADGGYGAPGELVVNPYTERDVNRDLLRAGKPGLAERVANEWRPNWLRGAGEMHASPRFAVGGVLGGAGRAAGAGGGGGGVGLVGATRQAGLGLSTQASLAGVHPGVIAAAQAIMSRFPGLTITSSTTGGHASGSYHYLGEALDISGASGVMNAAAGWVNSSGLFRSLAEGIHNPNLSVKFGRQVPPSFWGGATWGEHTNHIHVAVADGTNVGVGGGAAGLVGAAMQVSLHGLGNQGLAGVPGMLVDRGSQIIATGMQQKINAKLAAMGGGGGGGVPTGMSGPWVNVLQQIATAKGWSAADWEWIVQHESGGNPNAVNPSSGASGLGQMLGGNIAHYHGKGSPADQITGMGQYIADRYGNPTAAKSFWEAHNWYSTGGRMPKWAGWHDTGLDAVTKPGQPVVFGAGERRRERVTITPVSSGRPPMGGVHVSIGQVTVQGSIRSDADIEAIGEHVVAKIIQALDRGDHRAAELT